MGSFCCCPCEEEFEDYTHPTSFTYRHCICLRHFFRGLLNASGALRIDGRDVTLSTHGGTPLSSTGFGHGSDVGSLSETYRLVPQPASYDTDPRYLHRQRDGLVSRYEKSFCHIQEGSQAVKRSSSTSGAVHLGASRKHDILENEEGIRPVYSEFEKNMSEKASDGIDYMTKTEDEDVCPTCLEEYTSDNPKILAQCSHHFHLSCIYEWMERSELCPVCGKEMEFCESP